METIYIISFPLSLSPVQLCQQCLNRTDRDRVMKGGEGSLQRQENQSNRKQQTNQNAWTHHCTCCLQFKTTAKCFHLVISKVWLRENSPRIQYYFLSSANKLTHRIISNLVHNYYYHRNDNKCINLYITHTLKLTHTLKYCCGFFQLKKIPSSIKDWVRLLKNLLTQSSKESNEDDYMIRK